MKNFIKVLLHGIAESGIHTLPAIMFAFSAFLINDIKGEADLWAMTLFAAACVFICLGIFLIIMIGVQYVDYLELRKERDCTYIRKYRLIENEVDDGVCDYK